MATLKEKSETTYMPRSYVARLAPFLPKIQAIVLLMFLYDQSSRPSSKIRRRLVQPFLPTSLHLHVFFNVI
jgi:hypothetical protein